MTQSGTATTTVYVGNLEEVVTSGSTTTTTTFYYAGSARIALAVNGTFSYLASDGLASATVALNAGGSATASTLYAPYGGSRYSSGTMPTDYGFTGQHADSATGLDYFNARYYDPVAGQFTTADTILPGDGYDLFGLSRYAYVEGNPETRTDPSGRCPWCIGAVIGGLIGGGIAYGSQVVGNLQRGQNLGSALTHVDVGEIAKGALVGAVIGATGGLGGAALGGRLALGGAQGAGAQIGDNLLHGRSWHQGVIESAAFGVATEGLSAGGGAALRQVTKRLTVTIVNDGPRFWRSTTEFQGTKVYQRDDLIDPSVIDDAGRNNAERMRRGLAPKGPDGKSLELHHMLQSSDGPVAEVTSSFHLQYRRIVHINDSTTQSGIDRVAFNAWRRAYWIERSGDLARRGGVQF